MKTKHVKHNGKTFFFDNTLKGGYFSIDYASTLKSPSSEEKYVYNFNEDNQMFFNVR